MGIVRFGNDHFQQSLDMEIMFKEISRYVTYHTLRGKDLLTDSRDSNIYTISISEVAASSPVCLMSKATSIKSWLWHRRLSHLNFGTINRLMKKDLVDGLPKYEAPDMIINFVIQIQRSLQAQVLKVQFDNGTEFKNVKLQTFYEKLGNTHNTSTVRTPQQNGVVEQRNHTLVEATHTMLIFLKTLEFLWAKAIATACFT
ncbi:integrase, catalytic region, zinc finger, CCHC-type containing protein [Tanacetum coccineum]